MRRRERSHLVGINSSLFQFVPLPPEILDRRNWYEDARVYHTLTGYMVRSKSEVIIANMLHERGIAYRYEEPLYAPDGTFYLPDFTIMHQGRQLYWEHWGMMDRESYRKHTKAKRKWYKRFFPGQLIETEESPDLTAQADALIKRLLE
jgi:hypothetical protein